MFCGNKFFLPNTQRKWVWDEKINFRNKGSQSHIANFYYNGQFQTMFSKQSNKSRPII